MKLISLNTWGGKFFESLVDFIKQYSPETDIFCFQEILDTKSNIKQNNGIRTNLLQEIKDILPDFEVFYFPVIKGFDDEAKPVDFDLSVGQAIFIKKSIKVNSNEDYFITKKSDYHNLKEDFSNLPTPLQYINLALNKKTYSIFNFHGIPFPGDKLDSEERLAEAKKIKTILNNQKGLKILVGDFNLLPQTECIKIIEKDMKNLINEFRIQRTRSKLSPFYGREDFQKFADYIFVSKEIKVKNFEVPKIEISDHLPMILEFS